MFTNLSDSIKATLYDRIASPLFGAFLTSWIIWNYKIVLSIASNLSLYEKIAFIEIQLNIYRGLAYPLISAVIFILFYPWPARLLFQYWRAQQKKLKDIRQKIDGESLLTIEESKGLRKQLAIADYEHTEEIRKKDAEIALLNEELIQAQKKAKNYYSKIEKFESQSSSADTNISDTIRRTIEYLANSPGGASRLEIRQYLSDNHIRQDLHEKELEDSDYFKIYDGDIALTHKGKVLAAELGLA